jgi:hypothetical protein
MVKCFPHNYERGICTHCRRVSVTRQALNVWISDPLEWVLSFVFDNPRMNNLEYLVVCVGGIAACILLAGWLT